jgi:sec-independent protein translocase protein TatB
MGFADTVVLFVLALLLFGPKKLPGIARQVGKALAEFKRASNEFKAQIEAEISQLEVQEKQKAESQKIEQKMELQSQPPVGAVEYLPAHAQPSEPPSSSSSSDLNLSAPNTHHA